MVTNLATSKVSILDTVIPSERRSVSRRTASMDAIVDCRTPLSVVVLLRAMPRTEAFPPFLPLTTTMQEDPAMVDVLREWYLILSTFKVATFGYLHP